MFCRNCGKELAENAIMCPVCGTGTMWQPPPITGVSTKPAKLTVVGGLRLASGILNVLAGLGLFLFCVPLLLVPLGIVEIVSAANLLRSRPEYPAGLQTIAILEIISICSCAGWVSMIVGIVTLVLISDPEIRRYMDRCGPAVKA